MNRLPARLRSALLLIIAGLMLVLLIGCEREATDALAAIRDRGELRFITRNGPSTYYLDRDGPTGFDYALARRFAEELGVELVVSEAFTIEGLFTALRRGEADIAGAGLSRTAAREAVYTSTTAYAQQHAQLVYRVGDGRPREIADLEGLRLLVTAGSSHLELLESLRASSAPWLTWDAVDTADTTELLLQVRDGHADVAVVDSRDFLLQQRLVPSLEVAFDLGPARDVVWYLPAEKADSALRAAADAFLSAQRDDGAIAALTRRHFYRDEEISRVDSKTFMSSVRERLRDYRGLIENVAREYQLPWELLAAIAYQESHWDPEATSRTGVRGMMMLTLPTAEDLGVDDRTDPEQSMRGGARYFKSLRRRLPEDIEEPHRSWMALAAYNIGMAHLEDARVLTERRGGDPHRWSDVMASLPLLEDPQHYRQLRHGYARGSEAVRYVQNIRHYYDVLRLRTARERRPLPPLDSRDYLPEALRGLRLRAL